MANPTHNASHLSVAHQAAGAMLEHGVWDVSPRGKEWIVQRVGVIRAHGVHSREDDAIKEATYLALRHRGRVRIRGAGGQILDERSFDRRP